MCSVGKLSFARDVTSCEDASRDWRGGICEGLQTDMYVILFGFEFSRANTQFTDYFGV